MTPADEATFIALWSQGASYRQIAQAVGCGLGTVGAWASALVAQGKLTPRSRGGSPLSRHAQARQSDPPATPAPPTAHAQPAAQVTPASPAMTFVAVPEIQEMLSLMQDLHARVSALEQTRVPPALTAPPATPATHAPPAPERKDIQQWTVRLSKVLIEHLKAMAYERRMAPSQLVEELVWKALTDHQP